MKELSKVFTSEIDGAANEQRKHSRAVNPNICSHFRNIFLPLLFSPQMAKRKIDSEIEIDFDIEWNKAGNEWKRVK